MTTVADPLAGYREELNSGSRTTLTFNGMEDCPVDEGDMFELRSCMIVITGKRRVKRDKRWWWIVTFDRSMPERVYLLGRSGGYVEDDKMAMGAQADQNAGSPSEIWRENPMNLGPPPEPEAVPPHEVDLLPSVQIARAKHERMKMTQQDQKRKLAEGVRSLRDLVRSRIRDKSYEGATEMIDALKRDIKKRDAEFD